MALSDGRMTNIDLGKALLVLIVIGAIGYWTAALPSIELTSGLGIMLLALAMIALNRHSNEIKTRDVARRGLRHRLAEMLNFGGDGPGRTEESPRQIEQRFWTILDNTKALIYVVDIQGKVVLINRALQGVLRASRDQARGKSIYEFFPGEIGRILQANNQKVIDARITLQFEETIPHDDGPHSYVTTRVPLHDSARHACRSTIPLARYTLFVESQTM